MAQMRVDAHAAAIEQPDDGQVLYVMTDIENGNAQQQIINISHHKPPEPKSRKKHRQLEQTRLWSSITLNEIIRKKTNQYDCENGKPAPLDRL